MKNDLIAFDIYNMQANEKVYKTLNAVRSDADHVPIICGFDSYKLCLTGKIGRTLATPSGGLNEHIPVVLGCDLYNGVITGNKACNVNANSGASANHAGPSLLILNDQDDLPVVCLNFQGSKSNNVITDDGKCYSLNAMHGHDVHVVCFEPGDCE